eukprot:TRINITY_DN10690_c0_g1_i1.p1 TRINITY_DN10690_c0_g1~~TRINITY_DN10690_c0_g1_i1.p1  ORF type:complete len:556 (+),score=149.68 TRINITY_DN10690_c0_g1_i1:32-1699(+)
MNKMKVVALIVMGLALTHACTNFLITKGASADGANYISYNADSEKLYGALYHYPAADHAPGAKRDIHDWDTGEYLGQIDEVAHTYSVVGNINEHSVAIGETTFGGIESLQHQNGAIMDYGSLIWVTLQRSKTAREAILIMDELVTTYGYYSEGESFSIADPNEVWVMDLIGKGQGELGAVWVARLVPDGYVSGHANQARIQTFPLNDTDTCMYSGDAISFAKKKGLYPQNAPDEEFSFSDTYNPITFDGARFCESRVWSMFRKVAPGMEKYLDYVKGEDLSNRMPLWVKPTKKITLQQTMDFMRDHFEGTWLDFRSDIGATAFGLPYRWRPLTWKVDDVEYVNERAAGTQQTGWTFVAQLRNWLPPQVGGILWFGVDDADSSVYAPMYCGITDIPSTFSIDSGKIMEFSFDSAFWVFNMVTNLAYTRYNVIHPEVAEKIDYYEKRYITKDVPQMDEVAMKLFKSNNTEEMIKRITEFSVTTGNTLVEQWLQFWQKLFVKYVDGYVKEANPPHQNPIVHTPGYGEKWYEGIVEETGDHYKALDQDNNFKRARVSSI